MNFFCLAKLHKPQGSRRERELDSDQTQPQNPNQTQAEAGQDQTPGCCYFCRIQEAKT